MIIGNKSRKADKELYNNASEDFIPVACHYNENTLLSKNGELVQIIKIKGVYSQELNEQIFQLRNIIHNIIAANIPDQNFAFWLHTIRHKENIDDTAVYNKTLPEKIHYLWTKKNHWDNKFINTIYLSIIYTSPDIKLKNFNSFINSFLFKLVEDFHYQFLTNSYQKLNTIVDRILEDLKPYNSTKLGLEFTADECFSQLMFLYNQITKLNNKKCVLPVGDLSKALSAYKYAVGSDKIEIVDNDNTKRFTSIISIKEYNAADPAPINIALQLPIEFIATEALYFTNKNQVLKPFSTQYEILKISDSMQLASAKGINDIFNSDEKNITQFCYHQLSIAVITDTVEKLDYDVYTLSQTLDDLGIVHVREDINLEQIFWSQLPCNFIFLRRSTETILPNTACFACLYSFPTGNDYSSWGRAISLLRTEKGSPYFMNFHTKLGNGNTTIFGAHRAGKTVLMNFLLSESTKLNPTVIHLNINNDSKIFIEALEGVWSQEVQRMIHPFWYDDTSENRIFLTTFLHIICGHYILPLSTQELDYIDYLINKIFELDSQQRNFNQIVNIVDSYPLAGNNNIKTKLEIFSDNGLYPNIFNNNSDFKLSSGGVYGVNLYHLTNNILEEELKKLQSDETKSDAELEHERLYREERFKLLANIRVSIIYALSYNLSKIEGPKILAIDNIESLLDQEDHHNIINQIISNLNNNNGILLSSVNLQNILNNNLKSTAHKWLEITDTSIILPTNKNDLIPDLDIALQLTKDEKRKLETLTTLSRMFLLKTETQTITLEISLSAFESIVKILSSGSEELELYEKLLAEFPGHPNNWLGPLHKALSTK